MTFIDWSDSEEMLGLLHEYIVDERKQSAGDAAREAFLGELSADLTALVERCEELSVNEAIETLKEIRRSQPGLFASDSVLAHLDDCIEELARIEGDETV
ncbi:MAG: hypothetical protein ABI837_06055 [Acidobacteriota bacterium]